MKIVKYGNNIKVCEGCNSFFHGNSNNHRYCSEHCKMDKGINWNFPCGIANIIDFHNGVAEKLNVRWIRFGTRVTKGLRFFPPSGEALPLLSLPPLPHIGAYIVQFFDERRNPIPYQQQPFLLLPLTFCKFSDGSRSSVLRGE